MPRKFETFTRDGKTVKRRILTAAEKKVRSERRKETMLARGYWGGKEKKKTKPHKVAAAAAVITAARSSKPPSEIPARLDEAMILMRQGVAWLKSHYGVDYLERGDEAHRLLVESHLVLTRRR